MFFISASVIPAKPRSTCFFITSFVIPVSRSSKSSPTQKIGFNPEAKAFFIFLFISSSVSPKIALRSEWPRITYSHPTDFNIDADISPVNAPFSSKCMFCAPSFIWLPFKSFDASESEVNGGQTITSQFGFSFCKRFFNSTISFSD